VIFTKELERTILGCLKGNESFPCREHTLLLSNSEFLFMGYSDVRGILAEGMAMKEEIKQISLNKSILQVRAIAKEWYKKEEYNSVYVKLRNKKHMDLHVWLRQQLTIL
jgi:hypothetical protein